MAALARIHGTALTAVYDDRWHGILAALGSVEIQRASEVEYNNVTQEWEAKNLATGEIIAHGPNRNAVITQEIAWLESHTI